MESTAQMVTQLGLSVALVVFFVWVGWKRELRLSERVDELENGFRQTLLETIQHNHACMEKHTATMEHLVEAVRESNGQVSTLLTRMVERPCLVPKHSEG